MFENFLQYSSFGGTLILIMFGVLHLNYRDRGKINYLSACIFFSVAYMMFHVWLFVTGAITHVPWLLYSDLAATFFMAPVFYFYISELSGAGVKISFSKMYHFVPALVCFVFFIIYNMLYPPLTGSAYARFLQYPDYNVNFPITLMTVLADLWLLVYFLMSINIILVFLKKGQSMSRELRFIMYSVMLFVFLCLLLLLSHVLKNDAIIVIVIYIAFVTGIAYYIYSIRDPEFARRVIKEAKRVRYENSLPGYIDAEKVLSRLSELMEEERVFRDDELSLTGLSSMLKVTPHQLSQIINENTRMNFRSYVNSFRIREARRLLEERPELSIIEIIYSVGFNSKPSFNKLFLQETGFTPRDYRKKALKT